MTRLDNTAEGVNGATVTTGNTGPDQFTAVTFTGAGTTSTFSTAQTHQGATSINLHYAAATASTNYLQWSGLTASANVYCRAYLYIPNVPTASPRLFTLMSGTTTRVQVRLNSTGLVSVVDSTGTVAGTSASAVPTGVWCRIECDLTGMAGTTGNAQFRLYSGANLEGATADTGSTVTVSGMTTGGATANGVRVGAAGAVTITAGWDQWFDDLAYSDVAQPGPAGTGTTPVTGTRASTWTTTATVSGDSGTVIFDGRFTTDGVYQGYLDGVTTTSPPPPYEFMDSVGGPNNFMTVYTAATKTAGWPDPPPWSTHAAAATTYNDNTLSSVRTQCYGGTGNNDIAAGLERWYGLTFYVPSAVGIPGSSGFLKLWQADAPPYNGDAAASLGLRTGSTSSPPGADGVKYLRWQTPGGWSLWETPCPLDQWFNVIMHIVFHTNPVNSTAEIWLNGVQKPWTKNGTEHGDNSNYTTAGANLANGGLTAHVATMLNDTNDVGSSYLQSYRTGSGSPFGVGSQTLFYGGQKIGSSYAAVDPGTAAAGAASRGAVWRVSTSVSAARPSTWAASAAAAAASRGTTWATLTPAAATKAATWANLTAVTSGSSTDTYSNTYSDTYVGSAGTGTATTWNVAFTGGTTTVSATRASTWVAGATVSPSARIASWANLVPVAPSRATSWTTALPVTAIRLSTWKTSAVTAASRATVWQAPASVSAARASAWLTSATITGTRLSTWATLTKTAPGSRATIWTFQSASLSTRGTTWQVSIPAAAARPTAWSAAAAQTASRLTLWTAVGTVTGIRATTWRVDQTGQVTGTRATTWQTGAAAAVTRAAAWATRTAIPASQRTSTWAAAVTAASIRPSTWAALTPVTGARVTAWTVTAAPGTVTGARVTTWQTTAAAAAGLRTSTWASRTALSVTRPTTWAAPAAAAVSRVTAWNTAGGCSGMRASTWVACSAAAAARTSTWTASAAAAHVSTTAWAVRTPTFTTRATSWTARATVLSARAATWQTNGAQPTATRDTTWQDAARVADNRVGRWDDRTPAGTVTRTTTWTALHLAARSQTTAWYTYSKRWTNVTTPGTVTVPAGLSTAVLTDQAGTVIVIPDDVSSLVTVNAGSVEVT